MVKTDKACPFCRVIGIDIFGDDNIGYQIRCKNCGATGPQGCSSAEDAIDCWEKGVDFQGRLQDNKDLPDYNYGGRKFFFDEIDDESILEVFDNIVKILLVAGIKDLPKNPKKAILETIIVGPYSLSTEITWPQCVDEDVSGEVGSYDLELDDNVELFKNIRALLKPYQAAFGIDDDTWKYTARLEISREDVVFIEATDRVEFKDLFEDDLF
jgi:hypothetical protein